MPSRHARRRPSEVGARRDGPSRSGPSVRFGSRGPSAASAAASREKPRSPKPRGSPGRTRKWARPFGQAESPCAAKPKSARTSVRRILDRTPSRTGETRGRTVGQRTLPSTDGLSRGGPARHPPTVAQWRRSLPFGRENRQIATVGSRQNHPAFFGQAFLRNQHFKQRGFRPRSPCSDESRQQSVEFCATRVHPSASRCGNRARIRPFDP